MSDQWRILVVEDEENLNRLTVTSLRRDGYFVQGVLNGADAIRALWSEDFHVVICDLKTPGFDTSFELLQWIRSYRPNARMMLVASFDSEISRNQAFENGVVSCLERPLDLHQLKEELRSLLYQTGFSANLASFDLLDVIQMITMSRKTIALVVNTGLEERGVLRFQAGELIWAQYGILFGEEAFFALAAYKNGTVIHQPWNGRITPNVTQPLSRLILQAIQYREKYAAKHQRSTEQETIAIAPSPRVQEHEPVDDRPFVFVAEDQVADTPRSTFGDEIPSKNEQQFTDEPQEWWQQSERQARLNKSTNLHKVTDVSNSQLNATNEPVQATPPTITPSTVHKTPASQRTDLPSWLIDQPTQFEMPALRPSSLSTYSSSLPTLSAMKPAPVEWQPPEKVEQPGQTTGPQRMHTENANSKKVASPEWQVPAERGSQQLQSRGQLQSLSTSRKPGDLSTRKLASTDKVTGFATYSDGTGSKPTISKRNYPALVASLKTLGYKVQGFVATAIVETNGQPIAQVATEEFDISTICKPLSGLLENVFLALDRTLWGMYEDTVITSSAYQILLRAIGNDRRAFHILITSRETSAAGNLELMASVEETIKAYL